MKRAALAWLAIACTSACASTRVETQWRDPATRAQDLAFRQVIAVALVDDEAVRRTAEDELVRVLEAGPAARARGLRAVASYTLIPASELEDIESMRAKVETGGFDGAIVMRLVSSEERVHTVPGRYDTMWGQPVLLDPGYTTVDRIVRIETSLYSVSEKKLLWSGVTRTLNPADLRDLVGDVVRADAAELAAQGLLP